MEKSLITEAIGYAAAFLTTTSFLPQVIRTIKTKSARDLSYGMLLILIAGLISWLVFGLIRHQMPIILANSVTLVLASILAVCKFRYK